MPRKSEMEHSEQYELSIASPPARYQALPGDDKPITSDRTRHIGGRGREIACHALLLCIPMMLFSGLLFYLVLFDRVTHDTRGLNDDDLRLSSDRDEPGVYYVNFSATRLIFVASWSSSLAPLLVTSMAALWSHRVAHEWLLRSRAQTSSSLPTPYQLSLALGMLTGSATTSLYRWITYSFTTRKSKQPQGHMIRTTGSVLAAGTVIRCVFPFRSTAIPVR